jgi:hypothetical protein
MRAFSSNRLIEYFAPLFFFSTAIEGFLGMQSDFPQERQDRDPTGYTRTSSGNALKNDQEQPTLIPLIQIIFGTK